MWRFIVSSIFNNDLMQLTGLEPAHNSRLMTTPLPIGLQLHKYLRQVSNLQKCGSKPHMFTNYITQAYALDEVRTRNKPILSRFPLPIGIQEQYWQSDLNRQKEHFECSMSTNCIIPATMGDRGLEPLKSLWDGSFTESCGSRCANHPNGRCWSRTNQSFTSYGLANRCISRSAYLPWRRRHESNALRCYPRLFSRQLATIGLTSSHYKYNTYCANIIPFIATTINPDAFSAISQGRNNVLCNNIVEKKEGRINPPSRNSSTSILVGRLQYFSFQLFRGRLTVLSFSKDVSSFLLRTPQSFTYPEKHLSRGSCFTTNNPCKVGLNSTSVFCKFSQGISFNTFTFCFFIASFFYQCSQSACSRHIHCSLKFLFHDTPKASMLDRYRNTCYNFHRILNRYHISIIPVRDHFVKQSRTKQKKERWLQLPTSSSKFLIVKLPFIACNSFNGSYRKLYLESSIANVVNNVKTLLYEASLRFTGIR